MKFSTLHKWATIILLTAAFMGGWAVTRAAVAQANRPDINAGQAAGAHSTDLEGNPRPSPAGSNPDRGAFENPSFPTLPSSERLYFVAGDILYQMNLDGSDLRSAAHGLQGNEALAADPIRQKLYAARWNQSAQIQVFDVTAGDLTVFSDGPGDGGQGLAIDPAGHRMYRGLYYAGVYAMDMNTVGNWIRLVDSASLYPMLGQRGQLHIDPVNRQIYFRSAFNGDCGLCRYIWRVTFDGTNLVKIIPANGGDALALDLTEQKMYFSDVPGNYTVKRANLDGSAVETLLTIPAPYRYCRSMVLDVEHKKMYLNLLNEDNGYKGKAVARANMDGSGFEVLHTLAGNTAEEALGNMALFLPVSPAPQLKVSQQATPDPALAGSPLTYTLRVTNTGNVDLHAAITDTLPAHVSPTGLLTWTSMIAAPGGVWTRLITVTVEAGYAGTLINTAQATTTEGAIGLDSLAVNVSGYSVYLPLALGGQPAVPPEIGRSISILVDDFKPQPHQDETAYAFNRLDGDRGAVNQSRMEWGIGQVTATIAAGQTWGGAWLSLNHPIREGLPISFSAILPAPILPDYQSRITGLTVHIARGTPGITFRLELKHHGDLQWNHEIELTGGDQTIGLDLPPLGDINELVWVLDRAAAGDYIVLDRVSFTATTSITDTATAAFVWSYGQLLNNWNPATGLVRDKAKDASGEFDAIQATGSLAAATTSAYQLGVVERAAAIQIVDRISRTLLIDLPRFYGLWPHWVKTSATEPITIVYGTEWSSVDTVIAALGLLDAQSGLGLETSGTEQFLQAIDWPNLVTPSGLAHGYAYSGELIPYAWDVFGGESWLVELAYAGATGKVTTMTYPLSPTANGSGFIDELAWLFVPPPSRPDYWGNDWPAYRSSAADNQINYYSSRYPTGCLAALGLFGLSAGEVPGPSAVPPASIYQALGAGGRFSPPHDGVAVLGAPAAVPHYAALIASLRPQAATKMWDGLLAAGKFSPLNNIESLMFPAGSSCESTSMVWNQLKGSWNLALQTLGWGRYLAERNGQVPIVWQAMTANSLARRGYRLLAPDALPTYRLLLPTMFKN